MALKWNSELEDRTVWPNPAETRRMARFAKDRGVQVLLKKVGGCPSSALVVDPRDRAPHAVSLLSCDCPLFARCGGCQHLALLQTELNMIPDVTIEATEKAMVTA